ncbi:hypothetical protein GGI07_001257 [Coemansia sp. Benny D115]|nr:hypothetical protein GGI07_001257 [Coemansia sp. Benny D115]
MDSRQLTLLDQTIRPHLPATYRNLPCDSKLGDVAQDTALPTAAHLVYFPSYTNEFELSSDGYLADEAPPHPFTQRVWAGGLMVFNPNNPLRVGQLASQRKRVVDVRFKEKHGSDPLVLVRLALEMRNAQGPSTTEYRDLAYMKPVHLQSKVVKHRRTADFSHKLVPTEIFLFRYSALTWNSHRIHYDTRYAKEVEHHPGLLVHGPLTCTMLLQLLDCHMPENMVLKSFEYRATSPMYCQEPMLLNGRWMTSSVRATTSGALVDGARQCELWSTNNEGGITMRGVATLVPL